MPAGVPVATVSIDGAKNAGLLALKILGTSDAKLLAKFDDYRALLPLMQNEHLDLDTALVHI